MKRVCLWIVIATCSHLVTTDSALEFCWQPESEVWLGAWEELVYIFMPQIKMMYGNMSRRSSFLLDTHWNMWNIWCKSGNVLRFWKGSVEARFQKRFHSPSAHCFQNRSWWTCLAASALQCRGSGWHQGKDVKKFVQTKDMLRSHARISNLEND